MNDRGANVVPGLRGCGRGIGVALDQNRSGRIVREHRTELLDHAADLSVAGLPADPVQGFRLGEPGGLKKYTGEVRIGVLAGVQETRAVVQHSYNRGKLDNFRARADDYGYLPVVGVYRHKRSLGSGQSRMFRRIPLRDFSSQV